MWDIFRKSLKAESLCRSTGGRKGQVKTLVWVHRHKQSTLRYKNNNEGSVLLWDELFFTRLSVVHPAQDDLRGSVPTSHHVPRHLAVGLPRQTKVQDLNRRHVHLIHTEEAGVVNALIARNKDSLVVFVRVPWAHSLRWRRDFLVWGPAEEIQKIRLHEAKGKWNTGYCVTQWAGHEAAQETRFIIRRVNNVYRAHRVYLKTTYPVNYTSRVNVL